MVKQLGLLNALKTVSKLFQYHFPNNYFYMLQLLNALDMDNLASAQQLAMRLEQVITNMEGPSNKTAYV